MIHLKNRLAWTRAIQVKEEGGTGGGKSSLSQDDREQLRFWREFFGTANAVEGGVGSMGTVAASTSSSTTVTASSSTSSRRSSPGRRSTQRNLLLSDSSDEEELQPQKQQEVEKSPAAGRSSVSPATFRVQVSSSIDAAATEMRRANDNKVDLLHAAHLVHVCLLMTVLNVLYLCRSCSAVS